MLIRLIGDFIQEGAQDAAFRYFAMHAERVEHGDLIWRDARFTTRAVSACDGVLVFNQPPREIRLDVPHGNVVGIGREPPIREAFPYLFQGLEQYDSYHVATITAAGAVADQSYMGWMVERDYPTLLAMARPAKSKRMSCIASTKTWLGGHRRRTEFVQRLKTLDLGIDFYGQGTRPLDDKADGLLDYEYSIAIENEAVPNWFTEKLNDCLVCRTIPLYFGAPNVTDYYPAEAMIRIDIERPESAIEQIRSVLASDDATARQSALEVARDRVLNRYHMFAFATERMRPNAGHPRHRAELRPHAQLARHGLAGRLRVWLRGSS